MRNKNYYFFAATLIPLTYGDPPPISSSSFRDLCHEHLNKDDLAYLKFCVYDPQTIVENSKQTGCTFIDLFLLHERTYILHLAALRARKLGRVNPNNKQNFDHSDLLNFAKKVIEIEDPFEAELCINKERWQFLDEQINLNYFEVKNIYCYLLKLQLLERKVLFDTSRGKDEYQKLYNFIRNQ